VVTKLRIIGMSCNGCVRHVGKALRELPGVSAVEVSLAEESAEVTHAETTTLATLVAAVESAGYTAHEHGVSRSA
jgi:Cu+-exporting ATPase